MKRTIACLHAHHTNIGYINDVLAERNVELIHFVDPGLIKRLTTDSKFNTELAKQKVIEQIQWMASEDVDAILITCTNYIALLDEHQLNISQQSIIKLDEILFQHLCSNAEPQILLFSNPATVEGTMNRLTQYASAKHIDHSIINNIEVRIVEDSFSLLMQGEQQRYTKTIKSYIESLIESHPDKPISVAQLSMVDAAQQLQEQVGIQVGTPLKGLVETISQKGSS